jgi:glycosyltransferase involved in cell wall biosynthesis
MNDVIIDGKRYVPEEAIGPTEARPLFGVAVTTRNRWEVLQKSLEAIERTVPAGTPIVVVDDASAKVSETWDSRFELVRLEEHSGIARAKNAGLTRLYDLGVEHFFLFDDDTYPLVENWWRPYVESPEPHLMYIFQEFAGAGAPRLNDCTVLRTESDLVAYSTPRGVMLYAERRVLDIAGGMDPGFGVWGYEHGDWSNRIHAFGLTSFRYADVPGSNKLIYSMDEHVHEIGGHERSVPPADRKASLAPNKERHDRQYNKAIRYEFRTPRDVVLTAYLTGVRDPQRNKPWVADPKAVSTLVESTNRFLASGDVLLFANELVTAPGATVVPVEAPQNPYFDRWLHFYRYLRDHPEIRFVWCLDATDTELLNAPFDLEPGVLYVGYEPSVVGIPWMRDNHPEYATWIEENKDEQLLNCGVIGGERTVVMALCHAMLREFYDFKGAGKTLKLDMGAFNYVVRRFFRRTGPSVVTVFRSENRKDKIAKIRHK